jgi:succinate dehydrogenase / fumarate reductase cytochrome b subunit
VTVTASASVDSTYKQPALAGPTHFLLRRLHSFTGILFGGYVIIHLLVNATLAQGMFEGHNVYQAQVNKIHDLPFLRVVEWTTIFAPALYHTIYGIWITITGRPNIGSYPFEKNLFYFFQRVTALVLVFFIVFHIGAMYGWFGWMSDGLKFDPQAATLSVQHHFHTSWLMGFVIYPIGILCACYHLANGFWTAGITWGLTISAAAQRRWGLVCAGLFIFTLACGMTADLWLIAHPA